MSPRRPAVDPDEELVRVAGVMVSKDPKKWPVAVKTAHALRLRTEGFTFEQIGPAVGWSKTVAHRKVNEALTAAARASEADAEQLKALELSRLDALQRSLWPQRETPRAVDSILRVMQHRDRLLGLAVPVEYVFRLEQEQVEFTEAAIRGVVSAVLSEFEAVGHEDLVRELRPVVEGEVVPRAIAAVVEPPASLERSA